MSDAPEYLTDRSHILIAGVTGARTDYGGKTALANWWINEPGSRFDLRIFGNYKSDAAVDTFADATVASVEDLAEAMRDGARHISLTPDSADWEETHARLYQFVDALPDDMTKLVVHDEAPELDGDALRSFVRVAGNGSACKSLVLAQAPGDLDMAVRRQSILCWIGPATEDNRHVFTSNHRGNHFDAILEEHEPFMWSVLTGPDDDDRDTFEPVPARYAGEGSV